mmetsp:Transcript_51624/g.109694  ORF Transcript_51624/g.109694 Transcript_51624/m.109694 type:complete len:333 (+) Transcript_51624:135-1133(+)|eukprot:CAMPEP_0206451624 /NCGR_PEP_ID=MMETSP0324_2-20121206/19454_1 /ASSEMBLY_ACC=CAM_ASM_000836 /TAXON_ID=2866 /ORGANISM="Crypthecodinium cohnii, Strain Seligo" /LENGTH=332 /DNA_ID=CAMNT_0053921545 /DNA_START=120 /DNA_END=1118 /DNA_ORIENTATION=-
MGPPLLVEEDADHTVTGTWCWGEDGTLRHNPTGMEVSPDRGVEVDGRAYRLDPHDIEMERDGALGAGVTGVVEAGIHKPTGMMVAVKTVKVDKKEKREQMLNDIKGLIQAAGCPFLVQWYAGFSTKDTGLVKVVIEYMDRGSLADLRKKLGETGVPPHHLMCMASQMIHGLQHLQARRLLHRDVKPENVLHNQLGQVKLTDFGISKDLHAVGLAQTFVGTAFYMAPERTSGKDYSFASDVWSTGMVVYELATGKYPYTTKAFLDLYDCLNFQPEPRLTDDFPPALCDFVAQCLTRDPSLRPDAETLLGHEAVNGQCGPEQVNALAEYFHSIP